MSPFIAVSNPTLALAFLALAAAALTALFLRQRRNLLRRDALLLTALRALAVLAIATLILNPALRRQAPDPEAARLLILADASASMLQRDAAPFGARLDALNALLRPAPDQDRSPIQQRIHSLFSQIDIRAFVRNDLTTAFPSAPISLRLGNSSIGDALQAAAAAIADPNAPPTGAVLLLSDGAHIDGSPVIPAARRIAESGIPISTIGIGSRNPPEDVAVSFSSEGFTAEANSPASIAVNLANRADTPQSGTLRILRDRAVVAEAEIALDPQSERTVTFDLPPAAPGFHPISAQWLAVVPDPNPTNDAAQAMLSVQRDPITRLLLISGRPNFALRSLRHLLEDSQNLELSTLQRLADDRWLHSSLPHNADDDPSQRSSVQPATPNATLREAFPSDPLLFFQFDTIVVDTAALPLIPPALHAPLVDFVSVRSGGLLLLYNPSADLPALPTSLRNLIPARDPVSAATAAPTPLDVEQHPLFLDQVGSPLFDANALQLPPALPFASPTELSRAARVHIRTPDGLPALVTHAYGAGRVAWLGFDAAWRSRFSPQPAKDAFTPLWQGLLAWLSRTDRQRISAPVSGSVQSTGQPVDLSIQALGPDFLPRMDATVTATVIGPDGQAASHRLNPQLARPGTYDLQLPLTQPGAYDIRYNVAFPEGDALTFNSAFALDANDRESRAALFNEQLLRDIARLSGGTYTHFSNLNALRDLPVSASVPFITTTIHWARSLPFLLALLAVLAAEWWLRRRVGLR